MIKQLLNICTCYQLFDRPDGDENTFIYYSLTVRSSLVAQTTSQTRVYALTSNTSSTCGMWVLLLHIKVSCFCNDLIWWYQYLNSNLPFFLCLNTSLVFTNYQPIQHNAIILFILYKATLIFMSQILYINILVDWSLSGIMTSKLVIREAESWLCQF